jgi:hypothetical protein
MPKEERLVDPTPELMRLRIISVAALNCGTYLGGDSVTETSVAVAAIAATDVLELESCCASIVPRVVSGIEGEKYGRVRTEPLISFRVCLLFEPYR